MPSPITRSLTLAAALAAAALSAGTLSGCGACQADRPAWIMADASDDDALRAAAPGRSAGGEGIAREKAGGAARAELGRALEIEVSDLSDRLVKDLDLSAGLDVVTDFTRSVRRQYSSQALRGSRIVKYWNEPCADNVWAQAELPRSGLDALLAGTAREQLERLRLSEEQLEKALEVIEAVRADRSGR